MMYSFAEIEALTAKIRWMAVDLLGDRVSTVNVETTAWNNQVSLAIRSPDGWRHAVGGATVHVIDDPEAWTRVACAKIAEWLDAKAAPPEQPTTRGECDDD